MLVEGRDGFWMDRLSGSEAGGKERVQGCPPHPCRATSLPGLDPLSTTALGMEGSRTFTMSVIH